MVLTFAHPWFLLLLLLLPLLSWLKNRRNQPPAFVYSSVQLVRAVLNVRRSRSAYILNGLRWLGLALCIVALAQPRMTRSESRFKASGIDIAVAIDLSGSMSAEDFEYRGKKVNRLFMAKRVLKEFIDKRPSDRIGIVAFASQAYIAAPLTLDHSFLQKNLDRLELGVIKENQTAIGSGLSAAINRLRELKSKSKIVILMTDGVNNAGKIEPLTAAQAAQALGVKVYTVGVGSRGEFVAGYDIFGRPVLGRADLDEETLTKVAETTGGKYYRADNSQRFEEIYAEIDKLEKSEAEVTKFSHHRELYRIVAGIGLGILLIEIVLKHTLLRRLP
jgi:N-terminal double-transmembrane domain